MSYCVEITYLSATSRIGFESQIHRYFMKNRHFDYKYSYKDPVLISAWLAKAYRFSVWATLFGISIIKNKGAHPVPTTIPVGRISVISDTISVPVEIGEKSPFIGVNRWLIDRCQLKCKHAVTFAQSAPTTVLFVTTGGVSTPEFVSNLNILFKNFKFESPKI